MSAPALGGAKARAVLRKLSPAQVDLLVSIAYRTSQTARAVTFAALRRANLIKRGHGKDTVDSLSWRLTALGRAVANEAAPLRVGEAER